MAPITKINFKNMEILQRPKNTIQRTTISPATHHKSPSKNHVLHTIFLKNPCKNRLPPAPGKNHSLGSSIRSNTCAI
jgi:hypothetical protein